MFRSTCSTCTVGSGGGTCTRGNKAVSLPNPDELWLARSPAHYGVIRAILRSKCSTCTVGSGGGHLHR
jgi:hypothetical protein